MYRGLNKNQNYTWLICAAQNMKNIAIKKANVNGKPLTNAQFIKNILEFIKNINIFNRKIYA